MVELGRYIRESLISEAFKSQVLRDIAEFVKGHEKQYGINPEMARSIAELRSNETLVFPRGIQWDKLTDDDIVFGLSADRNFMSRPELTSPQWIVLWIHTKTLVTNMSCGQRVYRLGGTYTRTVRGEQSMLNLEDPEFTQNSRNKLSELKDSDNEFIIAIPKKTILKLSTLNLVRSRREARQGATALMSDEKFREENLKRYQDKIAKMAAEKKTLSPLLKITKKILDEVRVAEQECVDIKEKIKEHQDKYIKDMLSGAGVSDEEYMKLFMGTEPSNDSFSMDPSNHWRMKQLDRCIEHLRSLVNGVMREIKFAADEINSGNGYDNSYINGTCKKIDEYLKQAIEEHKGMADIINNIKSNLK